MKTAVYHANDDVRVEDRPVPEIGDDEVRVAVDAVGVCGSDVMSWYRAEDAPCVLGHEIAATVDAVGAGVAAWDPGDRVVVSHHVPCLDCRRCDRGEETLCDLIRETDLDPGGFCEQARVPAVNVDHGLFVLPDALPAEAGTFVEPLACAIRGQRRLDLLADDTVAVLGSGFTGLLHVQLARQQGIDRIFTTDPIPERRELANRLGADSSFDPAADVATFLEQTNDGRLADRVIVCTGAEPALEQAFEVVEPGGEILWFAPTHPDNRVEVPFNWAWREGITQRVSYGAAPRDMEQAIDLLAKGAVDVDAMVTHRFGLDEVQEAFRVTAEAEAVKAVVAP